MLEGKAEAPWGLEPDFFRAGDFRGGLVLVFRAGAAAEREDVRFLFTKRV